MTNIMFILQFLFCTWPAWESINPHILICYKPAGSYCLTYYSYGILIQRRVATGICPPPHVLANTNSYSQSTI